jgi:hypothetical protein
MSELESNGKTSLLDGRTVKTAAKKRRGGGISSGVWYMVAAGRSSEPWWRQMSTARISMRCRR